MSETSVASPVGSSFLAVAREYFALCLLSALGSIPIHLSIIWIEILVSGHGFTSARAGLALSALMGGKLLFAATSIAAPRLVEEYLDLRVTSLAVAASVLASQFFLGGEAFFPIWVLVGFCGGHSLQVGIFAAATSMRADYVFALRVSLTLLISGAIALAAYVLSAATYASFVDTMALALLALWLAAAPHYVKHRAELREVGRVRIEPYSFFAMSGLVLLFLVFASQAGFLAHVGRFISGSGGAVVSGFLAVAVAKLLVGLLLGLMFVFRASSGKLGFVAYSVLTVVTAVLIANAGTFAIAAIALIAYDLSLNVTASMFHGALSGMLNRRHRNLFLPALLTGGLVGPPVVGLSIDHDLSVLALLAIAATAVMSVGWMQAAVWSRGRRIERL